MGTAKLSLVCKVCGKPKDSPDYGKGGHGMCLRCYTRDYRDAEPSVVPRKREPGSWKNLQVHIDAKLDKLFRRAATRAKTPLGAWIESAIRAKLARDEDDT